MTLKIHNNRPLEVVIRIPSSHRGRKSMQLLFQLYLVVAARKRKRSFQHCWIYSTDTRTLVVPSSDPPPPARVSLPPDHKRTTGRQIGNWHKASVEKGMLTGQGKEFRIYQLMKIHYVYTCPETIVSQIYLLDDWNGK